MITCNPCWLRHHITAIAVHVGARCMTWSVRRQKCRRNLRPSRCAHCCAAVHSCQRSGMLLNDRPAAVSQPVKVCNRIIGWLVHRGMIGAYNAGSKGPQIVRSTGRAPIA